MINNITDAVKAYNTNIAEKPGMTEAEKSASLREKIGQFIADKLSFKSGATGVDVVKHYAERCLEKFARDDDGTIDTKAKGFKDVAKLLEKDITKFLNDSTETDATKKITKLYTDTKGALFKMMHLKHDANAKSSNLKASVLIEIEGAANGQGGDIAAEKSSSHQKLVIESFNNSVANSFSDIEARISEAVNKLEGSIDHDKINAGIKEGVDKAIKARVTEQNSGKAVEVKNNAKAQTSKDTAKRVFSIMGKVVSAPIWLPIKGISLLSKRGPLATLMGTNRNSSTIERDWSFGKCGHTNWAAIAGQNVLNLARHGVRKLIYTPLVVLKNVLQTPFRLAGRAFSKDVHPLKSFADEVKAAWNPPTNICIWGDSEHNSKSEIEEINNDLKIINVERNAQKDEGDMIFDGGF